MAAEATIELLTAADIVAEHVTWLWRDRLPLAMLSLLVGDPGHGKSTLAVELSARLTRGQLDGDVWGEPAAVLLSTAEDSLPQVIRPRLEAAGADLRRVEILRARRDDALGTLSLPQDVAMLEETCRATHARLLWIDPLVAHIPAQADGYRDQHMRRILAPLAGLAERTQCAVLAIMHLSKRETDTALNKINGSIAFGAAARSVLLLAADPTDPEGPTRVLAHPKCNVGPLAPALRLKLEGRHVEATDGTPLRTSGIVWMGEAPDIRTADLVRHDARPTSAPALGDAEDVLKEILADGPKTARDVYIELRKAGVTKDTAKRAKQSLRIRSSKQGFQGEWMWSLPGAESKGGDTETIRPFGNQASGGTANPAEDSKEADGFKGADRFAQASTPTLWDSLDSCTVCGMAIAAISAEGEAWCLAHWQAREGAGDHALN